MSETATSVSNQEESRGRVKMVDVDNVPQHRHLRYGDIRLTLGHQIARGGFSTVYQGSDAWGNSLAIKEFNEKANPLMWNNEVANYQRLRHPQIVHMFGAFELEDKQYILLQYGGLAVGRINLGDPRERRLILMLTAKSMLEALHFMHSEDFVHTDINPYNALLELTQDNKPVNVRLCDLGLTMMRNALTPGKHKAKWNPSPECIDGERFGYEGPKMDVYSTAQVLMEILNGENIPRWTDEEICDEAPRKMALSFNDPLGDALAHALVPRVEDRVDALQLWKLIRKAGFERS